MAKADGKPFWMAGDTSIEAILGSILLALVVGLTFVGVIARLGFNSGLPWQEELTRMLFVAAIYLGASFSVSRNDHIRLTILTDRLPKPAQAVLETFSDAVSVCFHLALAVLAFHQVLEMQRFPATTSILEVPLHLVFFLIPLMMTAMAIRYAQRIWRRRTQSIDS